MILFILNTLFYTIKLLAYSWFTNNQIFFKFIIIIALILIVNVLYKYPKPLENKLNVIADYYKIHNKFYLVFSFSMLLLYLCIFVGGILYLRFSNSSKYLDLNLLWNKLYSSFLQHNFFINFLNLFLVIMVIFSYIFILIKIVKFFKRYWIKLHIYYCYDIDNWYHIYICRVYRKYNYHTLIFKIVRKFPMFFDKIILKFPIKYHLKLLVIRIHYIVLITVFVYDIIYNNWILHNIYIIFPYIFLYDIYIRFCKVYDSLDILYSANDTAHCYLYAKNIEILTDKEIFLDGNLYEIESIAKVIFVYLKNGLNGKLLCIIIDGKDYWDEHFYEYSYYKDWKKTISKK